MGIRFIGGLIGGTIFSQYMIIRGGDSIFYPPKDTLPMKIFGSVAKTFVCATIGATTISILPVSLVFIPGITSICYRHYFW